MSLQFLKTFQTFFFFFAVQTFPNLKMIPFIYQTLPNLLRQLFEWFSSTRLTLLFTGVLSRSHTFIARPRCLKPPPVNLWPPAVVWFASHQVRSPNRTDRIKKCSWPLTNAGRETGNGTFPSQLGIFRPSVKKHSHRRLRNVPPNDHRNTRNTQDLFTLVPCGI